MDLARRLSKVTDGATRIARMSNRNDRATWIKGDAANCSIPPKPRQHPPRLVIMGSPGIGKSRQAEMLCAGLGLCHLATNDILQAAKSLPQDEQTPGIRAVLEQTQSGQVVSDSGLLQLIHERQRCLRCKGGFLLDGFPGTVDQAVALDDLLHRDSLRLDAVLNYTLPTAVLVRRLAARRTCQECNAAFHLTDQPPKVTDVCDYCGGILVQREDDLPETIRARIAAYEHDTRPLIEYYLHCGLIRTISADGPPHRVFSRTLAILDT